MDEIPEVKILLLGDSEVGKSTFLSRLSTGTSLKTTTTTTNDPPITLPTLRDFDQPFIFEIKMYNRPYRFEFYDTASPENWTLLKPNVVVMCFSCDDRGSLESCRDKWSKQITTLFAYNREIPLMLLGLKRDLRIQNESTLYPQEAYRISQELRCDRFAECSSITGELIREVFEDLARMACLSSKDKGGEGRGKSEEMNCRVM